MVRDSDLRDNLDGDLERLAAFKADLSHVRNDFKLWGELGHRVGGEGGPGNGHSDRTAAIALRRATFDEDNAARKARGLSPYRDFASEMAREYASIEDDLQMIHHAAMRLERLRQLATFTRATVSGEEGCRSCARSRTLDTSGKSVPLWTRVWDKCKGRRLCRWCSEFLDKYGVLPHPELVRLHATTNQYIVPKLIREYHPELVEQTDQRGKAS